MEDFDITKVVALISGILAILDKLYVYGKEAYIKNRKIFGTTLVPARA